MKRYVKSDSETSAEVKQSYLYQLLGRLQSDCDYVLNAYDGTYANSTKSKEERYLAQKFLWANNAKDQIAKMRELYDKLEIKPDWITPEDIDEYERRFKDILGDKYVSASSKIATIAATEDNSYANHLVKISSKDAKYAMDTLNKSHKTLGLNGAPGDPGYYVSEFEAATPGFMWASDTGLQILDNAGIPYTRIEQYKIENSEKIKASAKITASENPITLKEQVGDFEVSITIDMWYGDEFVPGKYGADAYFSGLDSEYRGNIYDESGKVIGDYVADDSSIISKNFRIDWGD